MITGLVQSNEGRIRLKVNGLRGREQEVEASIDTGYSAWLTLPPALVARAILQARPNQTLKLTGTATSVFPGIKVWTR